MIRTGYEMLDLITYFTVGKQEVRAWTIKRGTKAPGAAGVIHTDFERGFIKAEVIKYDDMVALGGEQAVKAAGKMRMEGKEYVVRRRRHHALPLQRLSGANACDANAIAGRSAAYVLGRSLRRTGVRLSRGLRARSPIDPLSRPRRLAFRSERALADPRGTGSHRRNRDA